MRNLNRAPTDKLTKALTDGGVSQENIEWLVPYLDMSHPEYPELLEQVQRQPTLGRSGNWNDPVVDLLSKTLFNADQRPRGIKAFSALVGPANLGKLLRAPAMGMGYSMNRQISILYVYEEARGCIGSVQALVLLAAAWNGFTVMPALLKAEAGDLRDAFFLLGGESDTGRVLLACAYIAKTQQAEEQMVRAVQEGVLSMLNATARAQTRASYISQLEQYVRAGVDGPLPVSPNKIRASNNYSWIDTSHAGAACFTVLDIAPALKPAFVLTANLAPGRVLNKALAQTDLNGLFDKMPWLTERMDVSIALGNLLDSRDLLYRMAQEYPEVFKKALQQADYRVSEALSAVAEAAAPELLENFRRSNKANLQNKAAEQMLSTCDARDASLLRRFIFSGNGLEEIRSRFSIGSNGSTGWHDTNGVESYCRQYGADPFALRSLIAIAVTGYGFRLAGAWSAVCKGQVSPLKEKVGIILDGLIQEGLSPAESLSLAEMVHDATYSDQEKETLQKDAGTWLALHKDYIPEAQKGSAFARAVATRALAAHKETEALCALTADGSKVVRALAVQYLTHQPNAVELACRLLESKKSAQREAAVEILSKRDQKLERRSQLEAALAKEKSAKLANAIRALLGMEPEEIAASAAGGGSGDLVKETLKGGKKRKVQWVLDATQQLVSRTGALSDEDRLAAVLVSCTQPGGVPTAKALAAPLDAGELAVYAQAVYDIWIGQSAPSKQKWVLTFASLFGGPGMVDTLKRQITQWPQEGRGAIACDAVNALALSPAPEGLLLVDSISRKFKFKQVKAAAVKALAFAAQELGLTPEELADRIVPDLGLDERSQRVFDYGPRRFTVTLSPALTLEVTNQDGKRLKSLPAPGKQDDEALAAEASAQFKSLKKQIKATVTAQTLRLEQALSSGRTWTGEGWQALFVRKPVMRPFAMGLIWGVYDGEGSLTASFRYLEDGSFNTVDEDEYTLANDAKVGLLHPLELDEEQLEAWRTQLSDYEITQPFPQLSRTVYRPEASTEGQTSLERFGGKLINSLSLSGKMLGAGWFRGTPQDAGFFYEFFREDGPIGVQLNFSGAYAGGSIGEDEDEVTVYDVVFYHAGDREQGYSKNLIPLGQLPLRLYSETVYQLEKATAASTETDPSWRAKR